MKFVILLVILLFYVLPAQQPDSPKKNEWPTQWSAYQTLVNELNEKGAIGAPENSEAAWDVDARALIRLGFLDFLEDANLSLKNGSLTLACGFIDRRLGIQIKVDILKEIYQAESHGVLNGFIDSLPTPDRLGDKVLSDWILHNISIWRGGGGWALPSPTDIALIGSLQSPKVATCLKCYLLGTSKAFIQEFRPIIESLYKNRDDWEIIQLNRPGLRWALSIRLKEDKLTEWPWSGLGNKSIQLLSSSAFFFNMNEKKVFIIY